MNSLTAKIHILKDKLTPEKETYEYNYISNLKNTSEANNLKKSSIDSGNALHLFLFTYKQMN